MLVPLKVIIGLKDNKHAKYPEFGNVLSELGISADWCYYVDRFGGWHYDHCGHDDHDPEYGSPVGVQIGMLLVPSEFAEKAVAMFPDQCSIMDESEAESFYNTRAHAHEDEVFDNVEAMNALVARKSLGEDVSKEIANALDPDHPASGRRRNKTKTWQGYKRQRGVEIHHEAIARLKHK